MLSEAPQRQSPAFAGCGGHHDSPLTSVAKVVSDAVVSASHTYSEDWMTCVQISCWVLFVGVFYVCMWHQFKKLTSLP